MPDSLSFLGEVTLRSSFVLAVTFALVMVMRRASASQRHLVLLFGLLVVALMPAGLLLSPKIAWTIPLPPQSEIAGPAKQVTAHLLEETSPPPVPSSLAEEKPSWTEACTPANGLAAALAGGMLVQAWLLGRAAWSWRAIRRRATTTALPAGMLARAGVFAGAGGMPPVLVSDRITVPLLAGWLRPAILLPAGAEQWPPEQLDMVLCHELAHFRRGDARWIPLVGALRIFYWWHPLVWLALARLRRERENACDDLVLKQDFRATDYADLIVATARHAQAQGWQRGALAMASSSNVGERIGTILNPHLNRRAAGRKMILAGIVAAFVFGWLSAAVQLQAEDMPVASNANAATNAPKPQVYVEFKLVEINEKTYQQQTAAIDEAVKSGNFSFLLKTGEVRIVGSHGVYIAVGTKADISMGKLLSRWDKSTPIMTLTASAVVGPNGKVIPTIVKSTTMGPTKTLLGMDLETTPSLSTDDAILLPIRYGIGFLSHYKDKDNFDTQTNTNDKKLSILDGKASGFFIGNYNASASNRYVYSLFDILNSPGNQIKTLPPLSPSPNRLALIVTARQVDAKATPTSFSTGPAPVSKPSVDFHVVLVSVDEKTYQREAPAMEEAIRKGDLHFFDNPKDGWVLRTCNIVLLVGQPGWYSVGSVQSYVASAKQEVRNGKPWATTLQANAIFLGLNADFSWSKDRQTLDSVWQLTEPAFYKPLGMEKVKGNAIIAPGDLPDADFHITTHADKVWDMTPGKEHAFWVGETFGVLQHISMPMDELIKTRTPSRLAVFMTAQPAAN